MTTLTLQQEMNRYVPAQPSSLRYCEWVKEGDDSLKFSFRGALIGEVNIQEACMKEPLIATAFLPHEFRAESMEPITFRTSTVKNAVRAVEAVFSNTGAINTVVAHYEEETAVKRVKAARAWFDNQLKLADTQQKRMEHLALGQIPLLFGEEVPVIREHSLHIGTKFFRDALKVRKALQKEYPNADLEIEYYQNLVRDTSTRLNEILNGKLAARDSVALIKSTGAFRSTGGNLYEQAYFNEYVPRRVYLTGEFVEDEEYEEEDE